MRQRFGRDHAALLAGAAAEAVVARRRARQRRVQGDRVGRGARHRHRLARQDPAERSAQARVFYRPRSEPGADRLVGEPIRDAQLRRPWRVLFRQHGGGRALYDRRLVLGIRRAGLAQHQVSADVRRRRGSRFQPDQDRPRPPQDQGYREVRLGQPDPHRLLRDRRRVARHPPRHRRALRPRPHPRAAARRQDRRGIPCPLHQCALARHPGRRRRR